MARKSKLFSLYIFIFFVIIFGLNNHHLGYSDYYNMDFENYYTAYLSSANQISPRNMEIGFKIVMYISNLLGLSLNSFRFIIGLFGFSLIFITIKKYSSYPNYVLSLYLIYPFINDVIQIRNFIAASIVIFSIRYLLEDKKGNLLKYALFVFLASLFHISSLFYLVLILVKYLKTRHFLNLILIVLPTLIILAYTSFYPFLVSRITSNQKVLMYLSRRTTWGLIIVYGTIFMMFGVHYILNREAKKSLIGENKLRPGIDEGSLVDKMTFYDILLRINTLILLLSLPLLIYDFNYIRLYRNILPLNYIVYVDAIMYRRIPAMSHKYFILIFISLSILFVMFYGLNASEQIFPVFNDNMLWGS
ncbi:MAG: hypothetical protein CVU85_00245 [Firmicutes bacterium HGW-Firmicutes-10]|nr:MAG: hypothetical protein CVU85_00245 [Firmicutes bacterium HGW-Firmicutes-10]